MTRKRTGLSVGRVVRGNLHPVRNAMEIAALHSGRASGSWQDSAHWPDYPHNGNVPGPSRQRRGIRPVASGFIRRHDRRSRSACLTSSTLPIPPSSFGLIAYGQHDTRHRSDPGGGDRAAGVSIFSARRSIRLSRRLRAARRQSAAWPRVLLRPAVHHRVSLVLVFGVDYRLVEAPHPDQAAAHRRDLPLGC